MWTFMRSPLDLRSGSIDPREDEARLLLENVIALTCADALTTQKFLRWSPKRSKRYFRNIFLLKVQSTTSIDNNTILLLTTTYCSHLQQSTKDEGQKYTTQIFELSTPLPIPSSQRTFGAIQQFLPVSALLLTAYLGRWKPQSLKKKLRTFFYWSAIEDIGRLSYSG